MDKKPTKLDLLRARLVLYNRVMFAMLVVGGLLGTCSDGLQGRPSPRGPLIIVITIIWWAVLKIVWEGVEAAKVLQLAAKYQDEQAAKKKQEKKEGGNPPGPPAAT